MSRCALCPGVNTCIGPDGPDDAELLFIGEAPGVMEQKKGRVFVGKTGEEVDEHYLPLAGLRRSRVLFTNAIRCLPVSAGGKLDAGRPKDLALLRACSDHHLYPLVERLEPRLLVPLGAFACRAVCPGVDLDLQHGYPVPTAWGIPAFPMIHPARGMHEPKKMLQIRTDWQRLRLYLKGKLELPVDAYPNPDYREVDNEVELGTFFLDPSQPIAVDTESTKKRQPFCLTFSQQPGTGRFIRAARVDLLEAFQALLRDWHAPILFHNWLYDAAVIQAMGLQLPHRHIVDTMVRAFHLGNLPQGLKALALRELGMSMMDFDDLVRPYSTERCLYYYQLAQTYDWAKPEPQVERNDHGVWELYQPQSMSTKLKRFFTDHGKNPEKDAIGAWDNWEMHHAEVEGVCGEYPGMCISHVPFEKVIHYACRDADATLRLAPILQQMSKQVRKRPQEQWRRRAA